MNNLFNTTFWALVEKGGCSNRTAEARLKGTSSGDKNEILFTQFGINYNDEHMMFRKGSFLFRRGVESGEMSKHDNMGKRARSEDDVKMTAPRDASKHRGIAVTVHEDIIRDAFWDAHPHLLAPSDLDPPRIRK